MKKNIHPADSVVRVLSAVIVAVLYFTGRISDATALVLGIVAAMMLLTGLMRFCPLYRLFGISSCKK